MNTIRRRRIELKMSQQVLANALEVERSTVTKWETGKSSPTADKLPQLAKILNCTIDDLFRNDKEVI